MTDTLPSHWTRPLKEKGLRNTGSREAIMSTSCQRVYDYTDFPEEELDLVKKTERALSDRYNFEISIHVIQFYGLCDRCKIKKGL